MCAPNIKRISFLFESQILFRVLTSTSGKAEFCGNDSPENPFCCLRHEALVSVENLMKTEPNSCSETKHDVNWRKHRLQVDSTNFMNTVCRQTRGDFRSAKLFLYLFVLES